MAGVHGAPLDTHTPDITPATSPSPPGHGHCARVTCLHSPQTRVTRVQMVSNHAEPGGLKTPESLDEGGKYLFFWVCVNQFTFLSSLYYFPL